MALIALLVLVYHCYAGAFTHRVQLDDEANLHGLANVRDVDSAMAFVFGGTAGPTGRPLALASFLIDRDAWPDAMSEILRTSTLVHLLNTVLVAWVALRLTRWLPWQVPGGRYALAVAALWGSAPLLLSTSVMAVQRMTSLAATCSLAALIAYLAARERCTRNPRQALFGMTVALGLGTLAGVLAKETAALFPLLVAVLETALLRPAGEPAFTGRWRHVFTVWQCVFFGMPLLLFAAYTVHYLALPESITYAGRGWSVQERVLTETRVLFRYLALLLAPVRSELGLFHDDFPVSTTLLAPATTLVAVAGWLGLAALALLGRGALHRVFLMAFGWFLVGHALESTVFSLELYFEHRNYLPSAGIVLGLCALAWHPRVRAMPAARAGLVLLVLCNLAVLRETALTWGDPVLAGERWFVRHPASHRTVLYYSRVLAESGDIPRAVQVMDDADPQLQHTLPFAAARLSVYCLGRRDSGIAAAQDAVDVALAGSGPVDFSVPQDLGQVLDLHASGKCPAADPVRIVAALDAVTRIPVGRIHPRALVGAHDRLARYWLAQRDLSRTMYHLEQEYLYSGSIGDVEKMVAVLLSAGLATDAVRKIDDASRHLPWNPVLRRQWLRRIDMMRAAVARSGAAPA